MPKTMPIAMAAMVSTMVPTSPARMLGWANQARTMSQWRFGAVATWLMVAAANSTTRTADTQRQGWRRGMALMVSGAISAAGDGDERRPEMVSAITARKSTRLNSS